MGSGFLNTHRGVEGKVKASISHEIKGKKDLAVKEKGSRDRMQDATFRRNGGRFEIMTR